MLAKMNEIKEITHQYINNTVTIRKYKWQLVSTHTARRSFATNLYLSGFPAISIMKITGHRTEASFLKYIRITQRDTANQLAAFWAKQN